MNIYRKEEKKSKNRIKTLLTNVERNQNFSLDTVRKLRHREGISRLRDENRVYKVPKEVSQLLIRVFKVSQKNQGFSLLERSSCLGYTRFRWKRDDITDVGEIRNKESNWTGQHIGSHPQGIQATTEWTNNWCGKLLIKYRKGTKRIETSRYHTNLRKWKLRGTTEQQTSVTNQHFVQIVWKYFKESQNIVLREE